MQRNKISFLLIVALSASGLAAALFEDQAGTYDWYRQHIGIVSSALFHPTKPRVCVSSAQRVLGCLNLRDGSIAWRKLLNSEDASFEMGQSQALVAAGGSLQVYDLEGNLKWQRKLLNNDKKTVLVQLPDQEASGFGPRVLALQGTGLQVFSLTDGTELLKSEGTPGLNKPNVLGLATDKAAYAMAYQTGSFEASIVELEGPQGKLGKERIYQSPMALSAAASTSANGFALLSEDGTAICTAAIDGATTVACHALSELSPSLAALRASRLVRTSTGYTAVSTNPENPGAALLASEPSGGLKLLRFFPTALGASEEIAADRGNPVVGIAEVANDGLRLVVVSSRTGETVHEEAFPTVPSSGRLVGQAPPLQPTRIALGSFRKKDKGTGFRALVSFSDGVTVLLQQGVVVWSRDESLAAITEAVFVDLPARSAHGTALSGQDVDLSTRLRYQLLGAKVQLKLNTPEEAAAYLELRSRLSDKNAPNRDVNGFRKLLLALTSMGKVAALHSGDGRVLWSRMLPPDSAPTRLLLWREYHDIQHAPEVLLLREVQPDPYAVVLNAHTGAELWRLQLSYSVQQVVPLYSPLHEGSAVQSLYMLVEQHDTASIPRVHLLPDTAASRAHFAATQRSPYFFSVGQDTSTLQGFRLGVSPESGVDIAVSHAWQLAFPDSILAAALRDPSEPIQSSVKVLSDRSIKYKYLNPNLLFVATGLPAGAPMSGADSGGLSAEVTVHLIDTVTGRILYRQSHAAARGPVTAVLTENAVLYFFRDLESGRHVAASMELYDATTGREFSVLDYLFNPNSTRPVSSLSPTPVEVLTQSFYTRIIPTSTAVTRTEQGITAKQLLLVTNTDQVYALDRRWVDPRRPKKQKLSQEEMEEGLVPYQDTLPLSPLSFATLDKQVLGVRGVVVEPTRLESTCLMFAHGVDMFFTRLAPAKGFDSLEDDFNYGLLLAALVGLAAGSVVMWYMAKQTMLGQKWK